MKLFNGALAKLYLIAYTDREMRHKVGTISAMYNPDKLELSYKASYTENNFINSSTQSNSYAQTHPGGLILELLFDAYMPENKQSIDSQIDRLRNLCYAVDKENNETHFLKVFWGNMHWNNAYYFSGRMESLSINYTLFDRDGTALRANASLSLIADESLALQASRLGLTKPSLELLHVSPGATLALLASASGINILNIAASNNLNNFQDTLPNNMVMNSAEESTQS